LIHESETVGFTDFESCRCSDTGRVGGDVDEKESMEDGDAAPNGSSREGDTEGRDDGVEIGNNTEVKAAESGEADTICGTSDVAEAECE
jgi:hypothetical protein